jgi:hypothetical protein
MANEDRPRVWVKLVIDGDKRYDAFQSELILKTYLVDDLKKNIMEEAKIRFDKDIHSLKIIPPGTDEPVPEDVECLLLFLLLTDRSSPSRIASSTPLIVAAKSRQ